MPLDLDSCIAGVFTPGNIGASSGQTPIVKTVPTFEDPDEYDPEAVIYSLDFSKFYNSFYIGAV
jgi:hypothetical protein